MRHHYTPLIEDMLCCTEYAVLRTAHQTHVLILENFFHFYPMLSMSLSLVSASLSLHCIVLLNLSVFSFHRFLLTA
jgi:hypothetical protein